jgi:hypothetical protein
VPRLSIIIPVLGSADRLETTLVSVLENRPHDCEILVVHSAPYEDPYDLAEEVRFLPVERGTGLVDSINTAIQASNGCFLHVLAAGSEVTDGWTERPLAHFQDPRVASVSPLIVDSLDQHDTLAAGLGYSCWRGRVIVTCPPKATIRDSCTAPSTEILGPLVQAAFYRRSALEMAGGLPGEVGDVLADVDLALALRFAGYKAVIEPQSIVRATAELLATPRLGFRRGLAAERLFWRAAPMAGWWKSLAAHPLGMLIESLQAVPRPAALTALVGRFIAVCQVSSHRAHHQRLLDMKRAAAAMQRAERTGRLRIDAPHTPGQSVSAKSAPASAPSAV